MSIDPQLLLLATTIAGFIVQAWRENRNRKWAAEDRAAATAAIIATATAEAEATRIKQAGIAETLRLTTAIEAQRLATEVAHSAEKVRLEALAQAAQIRENSLRESTRIQEEQRRHNEVLAGKIEEAKIAAHEAYKEANAVNGKISDLNERIVAQQELAKSDIAETRTIGNATLKGVEDMAEHDTKIGREIQVTVAEIHAKVEKATT